MQMSKLQMMPTDIPGGVQAVLDFGKYHLSIIKSDFSYGGKQGLYEIGVFAANDGVSSDMVELPGITSEGDTVQGYLTESDVDAIITKMFTITGKQPEQV
jgi:hypothetical protein